MNKNDLAYLAGYTDGDGCFYIGRVGKKFRNSFVVSSSNPEILKEFQSIFSGIFSILRPENAQQKPYGQWTIQGKRAREIAENILPFLVQRKKECEIFLSYFDTFSPKKRIEIMEALKHARKEDLIQRADLEKLKNTSPDLSFTLDDLIYLAGFVDAECCMTIQRDLPKEKPNPVFKIILRLNDTRSTIFYWLKSRFGGSITWMNKPMHYNPQLIWILRGEKAYELIKRIVPYLKHKRPIAMKIIEFYETTLPNGGARHTQAFRDAYGVILTHREELVSDIRKLNHKGL